MLRVSFSGHPFGRAIPVFNARWNCTESPKQGNIAFGSLDLSVSLCRIRFRVGEFADRFRQAFVSPSPCARLRTVSQNPGHRDPGLARIPYKGVMVETKRSFNMRKRCCAPWQALGGQEDLQVIHSLVREPSFPAKVRPLSAPQARSWCQVCGTWARLGQANDCFCWLKGKRKTKTKKQKIAKSGNGTSFPRGTSCNDTRRSGRSKCNPHPCPRRPSQAAARLGPTPKPPSPVGLFKRSAQDYSKHPSFWPKTCRWPAQGGKKIRQCNKRRWFNSRENKLPPLTVYYWQ